MLVCFYAFPIKWESLIGKHYDPAIFKMFPRRTKTRVAFLPCRYTSIANGNSRCFSVPVFIPKSTRRPPMSEDHRAKINGLQGILIFTRCLLRAYHMLFWVFFLSLQFLSDFPASYLTSLVPIFPFHRERMGPKSVTLHAPGICAFMPQTEYPGFCWYHEQNNRIHSEACRWSPSFHRIVRRRRYRHIWVVSSGFSEHG
jgi:hypothetical protein